MVDLVSALIRFDTSNTGEPETTKGEAECARWVAEQLEEVGYTTEYVEAGAPGRGNLFARLEGANPDRGALLLHGHLDVVPAEASDWSVHPFSGAVEDGYVWGRGAVDMKDMVGMMIAIARHFKRAGIVPPRDLVFAFVSDEEAGGKYGCEWLVDNRPDLFDGVTEAVGEVGGFSLTIPRRDGGERRLYLIEAAEKSMMWMRLTARSRAGHGMLIHDDNAVTAVAEAVAKLGRHRFPLVLTDTVEQFLQAVAEETGYSFDAASPDLDGTVAKLGPIARLIGATLRDTANPTMLKAGYKANVIPATAEAVVDCRILPGPPGRVRAGSRRAHRPRRDAGMAHRAAAVRDDLRRRSRRRDERRDSRRRPRRPHSPVHAPGWYGCKSVCPLGNSLFRLHAVEVATRARFRGVVPRRRRAGTRRCIEVRHTGSRAFPDALLTTRKDDHAISL